MKDTTKWILAAIAVLLIIVVGAFALSNGNNQPTVTPTTTPTATVTATAVPSASPSASPAATVTSTATPTATPSPINTGASGVRQTDFGYYITYPPFSYSDVHANPNYMAPSPSPSPQGQVQFTHSEGYMNTRAFDDESSMDVNRDGYTFTISIPLTRSDTCGSLSPHITISDTNVPDTYLYIENQPVFNDGQATVMLTVVYTYYGDHVEAPYGDFSIGTSPSYNIGSNNQFHLDLYMAW